MQGGQDDEPVDDEPVDDEPVDDEAVPGDAPERDAPDEPDEPDEPVLPAVAARPPLPMVDPTSRRRPGGAATWYRTDEDRARSVYRRANPWYRRVARGVVGLAFLGVAGVAVFAAALAVRNYMERDQLPSPGAEVPDIRATSFLVTSAAPAPAVDGTLTLDTDTGAFEFVGRATGPQSGLQVVSPDGDALFIRQGAGPWRGASASDGEATAVRTAATYLADDDSADAILTNRLRRGFVELLDEVDEGDGDDRVTRYEMAFDTDRFARDFPLQWQEYQSGAVPGATPGDDVRVTIWVDDDDVLVRVDEGEANWSWERLTYSDQPFRPVDPEDDAQTRIVQVACVSDDNSIFWQTPYASCGEAIAAARDAATAEGVAAAFDDLDRAVARICSTMEREDGPVSATSEEATFAGALVAAGVCRGDPTIFTSG